MADTEVNPVTILSLLFLIFSTLTLIRYVVIVFSIWSFAVGLILAYLILRNWNEAPNLLMLLQLTGSVKTPKTTIYDTTKKVRKGCTVCSKKGCSRHRPEISHQSLHPWEDLKIPKRVDEALTEFFEIVLRTHLYSWYWDLSHDQGFVDQARYILRYAVTIILQRTQKVNIPEFLLKKCLKKFMIHVDCYFRTKERASYGDDIQALVIEKIKTYKHFSLQNDLAEEEYLRYTIHTLLPYLLPRSELECRSAEYFLEELLNGVIFKTLAEKIVEPDFVNNLLLIFLDEETLPEPNYPASEKVTFLEEFGRHRMHHAKSALMVSAYDLMHDAKYLYPFMQFMKREGSLNILQFCLAVEEFNKRSLAADATEDDQAQLFEETQEIDALYFKQDAVDKINFPKDIVTDFQDAVASPKDAMMKLRTAAPLFRAYEHAVDILEKIYAPLFHQSEEFYALLCGNRISSRKRIVESNLSKRKFMPFAELSKIAGKIKAKKQKVKEDKSLAIFLDDREGTEEAYEAYEDSDGDYDDNEDDDSDDEVYDLSYWHVIIANIDYIFEKNKKVYVFVINVERIGGKHETMNESKWQVVRKYNEFYVLDAKLRRFHDTVREAELPPKRTILKKDHGYLESIRFRLQEYLQKLVRSPVFRGSSLLHSFLTPGGDITGMFEQESVGKEAGRKVISLKSKLVVEKGQNLEPFLNAFITSCEPPVKKRLPIKCPPTQGMSGHKRRDSRMYLPPPAWARDVRRSLSSTSSDTYTDSISSVTQYILYIARNHVKVPSWLHHCLICFQYLCKNTLDAFVERYVTYKLSLVTAELQLVSYIHLIRDIIFFDNDPPRTDSDKVERRDKTLSKMLSFFPERVKNVIGGDNHDHAIKTLFEMFQYPKLNKQLLFILFDELLFELFPELQQQTEKNS